MSEDELASKFAEARKTLRWLRRSHGAVERYERELGRECVELYDAGMSVAQVAKGLDISRREAQRYIGIGRENA